MSISNNLLLPIARMLSTERDGGSFPVKSLNLRALNADYTSEQFNNDLTELVDAGLLTLIPDAGPGGQGVLQLADKPKRKADRE